jgi:hypothetical protein
MVQHEWVPRTLVATEERHRQVAAKVPAVSVRWLAPYVIASRRTMLAADVTRQDCESGLVLKGPETVPKVIDKLRILYH